jgi:putative ABC transport system permease protein
MSITSWRRYVRFWGNDVEADVDDEFRFHLETEIEQLVARGSSPDAARAEALRRFGNVDLYRQYCRSADARRLGRERRTENLTVLLQDLRYAARSLLRRPAFTAIAVLTVGIGIGATTAIFSVVNGVLLQPLPYREPDRLVMLWETVNDDRIAISYQDYLDWQRGQRGFEDIAVYNPFQAFNMTGRGKAERVRGALVSGNFFHLLGARAEVGRLILPRDDRPEAPRVAILGDGYFRGRFGGDRSIIGQKMALDGDIYTIVGVLAPEVRIPDRDVVLPIGLFTRSPMYVRENHPGLIGLGRLRPSVSLEQARADLQHVSAELRAQFPKEDAGIGSGGAPLMEMMVGRIKPALRILMIAAGLVLLIACVNVANLVLSRAAVRERELAVRMALGASRGRIVRQVLTESAVIAFVGGALGIAIAYAGVKFVVALNPTSIPRLNDVVVDAKVLLFATVVSVLTGLLFGLGPALRSARSRSVTAVTGSERGSTGGVSLRHTRAMLTVAQVALAVVLLADAGLLMRSFAALTAVDLGFDPTHVVVSLVQLPDEKYATAAQARAVFDRLLEKVRAIPGVESATVGSDQPLGTNWQTGVSFEALPPFAPGHAPLLNATVVDPSYFETLHIPILAGRAFTTGDRVGQPLVVVISEAVAKKYFRGADPIGQRMKQGQPADTNGWRTIVGVVKDTRSDGLTEGPRGTFYMPRAQEELRRGLLMVRSSLPVDQLTTSLRAALADVDGDVPLALTQTMDAVLGELVEQPKFSMLLVSIFACVALALASVGIYGVVSYGVTQRTREIGVRIAIGAEPRAVIRLVLGQAVAMTTAGAGIGVLLALLSAKAIGTLLYGVGPRDPLVLLTVSGFLLAVALVAALAPALRAARIDPIRAIRVD